jgi:hypothetical protein
LPDRRVLIVKRVGDDGSWELKLAENPSDAIVGKPLNSCLASLLGYRIAHDEWPEWIDTLANEIEST